MAFKFKNVFYYVMKEVLYSGHYFEWPLSCRQMATNLVGTNASSVSIHLALTIVGASPLRNETLKQLFSVFDAHYYRI
jgi:hypothetical protein